MLAITKAYYFFQQPHSCCFIHPGERDVEKKNTTEVTWLILQKKKKRSVAINISPRAKDFSSF